MTRRRLVPLLPVRMVELIEFCEPFLIGLLAAAVAAPFWFPWSAIAVGYAAATSWAWWLAAKERAHGLWGSSKTGRRRWVPRLSVRMVDQLEFFESFAVGALAAGAAGLLLWPPWGLVPGIASALLWAWWLETKYRAYRAHLPYPSTRLPGGSP